MIFLFPDPALRIIRRAGDIQVHVLPAPGQAETEEKTLKPVSRNPKAYAMSFGMSMAALGAGFLLRQYLQVSNVTLVLLVAVLASAVTYGLWPSLFAGLICAMAYNFFFLPPLYTFTIADPENIITLMVFALVAVIAGNLAARVRTEAIVARQRAAATEDMYLFSRKLAGVVTLDDLLWATAYQVSHMLGLHVVLLLPEGEELVVRAGYPPEDMLDDGDLAAARWAFEHGSEAGRGADTLPGAKRLFLPMKTGRGIVGIIGLDSPGGRDQRLLTPDQRRLLDSLSDQAALAVERILLAEAADRARIAGETEKLRSALMTSLSHDLKTPLAAILGSASSLKAYRGKLDAEGEDELLRTIQEEAERLNHFIANLLDMTRLESGGLAPRLQAVELSDVMGSVLRRVAKLLAQHRVALQMEKDLPLLKLDPVLFEQALFNLLDNEAKYAPPESEIVIAARRRGSQVTLTISDEGDGLPEEDLEKVFDKFYRVRGRDKQRAGTGLGLAICRGFLEAMGGSIHAANRQQGHGAIFTLMLPVA